MAGWLPEGLAEHLSAVMAALAFAGTLVGAIHAAHAVLTARSPEGSIAWALSLIFFPWLAVPLYWIFGRNKFDQYAEVIRESIKEQRPMLLSARKALDACMAGEIRGLASHTRSLLESVSPHPFIAGNEAKLLIDGEATFKAIFEALDRAESYVLVEYYIFKHDSIGKEFIERLVAKAKAGLQVHFIYDELGSGSLPSSAVGLMRSAGVQVSEFGAPKRAWASLRINFRNHRKIVVVDGAVAFLGGLNVGDEYLTRRPYRRYWRDTHLRLEGPAALAVQSAFLTDLAWASDYPPPKLSWKPRVREEGACPALVLPTGPADGIEACSLFFIEAICSARERIWLATPYFVPDVAVVKALQLAACRGVDVRIVIPRKSDNPLVSFASLSFLEDLAMPSIQVLRYYKGFMHQKVLLVDGKFASVGTANLDNRSLYLNFEICAIVASHAFVKDVEAMFEEDFKYCHPIKVEDYLRRNPAYKVLCQTARLLAPVL